MNIQMPTLMLALAALGSPASAQLAKASAPTVPSDTFANTVTVQNTRKVPVTIFLEWGQFDRRLGVVAPFETATLALPAWVVRGHETVRLFAHPEGDPEDLSTEEFSLESPGRIAMVVAPPGGLPDTPTPTDTMSAVIPPEELADATLTVDNARNKPVTVFAEQGEFDVRLGQVPAHSRMTLRFPKSVVRSDESIELFVQPQGEADLASETMTVRKGDHLGLRVPAR
jgi:hypothetical protein